MCPLRGLPGTAPSAPPASTASAGLFPQTHCVASGPGAFATRPGCSLAPHPASSRPPVGGVQAQGLILTNPAHPHPPEGSAGAGLRLCLS